MDSETHLYGSVNQIESLANQLLVSCKEANKSEELQHVPIVLEQTSHKGPLWLVLTICPDRE